MKEDQYHISEYVLNRDLFGGCSGILKHCSEDFVVEEVGEDGCVVRYDPDCVIADSSLIEEAVKQPKQVEAFVFDREAASAALNAAFPLDASFAERAIEAYETESQEVLVYSHVIPDKEQRTHAHQLVRRLFNGNMSTEVRQSDGLFSLVFQSTKGKDRRSQGKGPQPPAQFLQFTLWKEGMDTIEAINTLARRLHIPPRAFSYAGTKDRRAVTTQRVVVRGVSAMRLAQLNNIHGTKIKISHISKAAGQLQFGDLSGNRFVLLLRQLCAADGTSLQTVNDLDSVLNSLRTRGFINYYGLQRFGTGSISTDAVGRALLNGDFEGAVSLIMDPKEGDTDLRIREARQAWLSAKDAAGQERLALLKACSASFPRRCTAECQILAHLSRSIEGMSDFQGAIGAINRELRLMYVHSVQSVWWNEAASLRIQKYGLEVVKGDLVLASNGEAIPILSEEEATKHSIFDVALPLLGHDIALPQNSIGDLLKSHLEGLDAFWSRPKNRNLWDLPGGYRRILQRPIDLRGEVVSLDESSESTERGLRLSFTLPTSAYATMLLREVFPSNVSTHAAFHRGQSNLKRAAKAHDLQEEDTNESDTANAASAE